MSLSAIRGGSQLQCGRIYKDAEIAKLLADAENIDMLQCGRIYKDAEIS